MSLTDIVVETISEGHDTPIISSKSHPTPFSSTATLPSELLGEVLVLSKLNHKTHLSPNLWVSHTGVCRYWREVALSTPLLWRDIQIPVGRPWSIQVLQDMVRRSSQMLLHLNLRSVKPDDMALIDLILAELHRMEDLPVFFYDPWEHCSYDNTKDGLHYYQRLHNNGFELVGISDAPSLRTLKLRRGFLTSTEGSQIPFVSPKFPLKHLGSIQLANYPYHSVSQFFRPTLKHLSLNDCEGGTVMDFLHALGGMPLLQSITMGDAFHSAEPLISELPKITLQFLQKLYLFDNNTLSCAQIIDHLLLSASTHIDVRTEGGYITREVDNEEILSWEKQLFAAIASSAAVRTLHVGSRAIVHCDGDENIVRMWTDDPDTCLSDERYTPPIPSTPPFCRLGPDIVRGACDALQMLCSAAPSHLGSIRTVIVSNHNSQAPWDESSDRIPACFWSDSFMCMDGLESLYLDWVVWDGLNGGSTAVSGTVLPFPRLRLLSLSRICFRRGIPKRHDPRLPDHIDSLRDMLDVRKREGSGLAKLVILNVVGFDQDDSVTLGAYVEELKWDGVVRYLEDS